MKKNWKIKEADNKEVNDLAQSLGVSISIAQLLVLRGITTFDEAKRFFRPDFSQTHKPFLMKDMQNAVDRLQQAILNKEKILIDFVNDEGWSLGRSYKDAPEIDNYVKINAKLEKGKFYDVLIKKAYEYDVIGELINE